MHTLTTTCVTALLRLPRRRLKTHPALVLQPDTLLCFTKQGISYVADFLTAPEEAAVLRCLEQVHPSRWVASGERRIVVRALAAAEL